MNRLIKQIAIKTFWAVLVSVAMTVGITQSIFADTGPVALLMGASIPATIAPVVTWLFERQRMRLQSAFDELTVAHAELERLNQELDRQAKYDFMTGLLNRRYFTEKLTCGWQEASSGVLLCIDADNFKQINDTFGHKAGDEALKTLTDAICSVTRSNDVVARIGGEEFAVFLPNANYDHAEHIAERIRCAIEQAQFHPVREERYPLSASIGSAFVVETGDFEELLDKADRRMYAAKRSGKNCVVFPARQDLPLAA